MMRRLVVVVVALLAALGNASCRNGAADSTTVETPARTPSPQQTYYPLAVGNSWTFRCSAEGEFQFEKTVRITSDIFADGNRFYRAEMTRPGDAQPLVYYLFESPDTTVWRTSEPTRNAADPLVRSTVSRGDRVGKLIAAGFEKASSPATGEAELLRLENFSADDPTLSEAQRFEWQGRSYAKGVGPVIEADGLGNECVLVKHRVKP